MSEQFGNASNALKVDSTHVEYVERHPAFRVWSEMGEVYGAGRVQSVIYQLHSKSGT
jgi:hypothetical protein